MSKIKNIVFSGIALAISFPLLADDRAPGDITISYPQQFISYQSLQLTAPPLDSFQYTVQVNTDSAVDNIYYHLAQQFHAPGAENTSPVRTGTYYSGIQPHPDGTVAFRFSSFIAGSKPKADNCRNGADEGAGVTCGVDRLPYTPGGKYTINIQKTDTDSESTTYTGTVTDETIHVSTQIGAWSVPNKTIGALAATLLGTVELYKIKRGQTCADIPLVNVEYSNVLLNGRSTTTPIIINHFKPSNKQNSVTTCSGIPRSTTGKATKTATGYIISNSDR